jgi:hypothetical protein
MLSIWKRSSLLPPRAVTTAKIVLTNRSRRVVACVDISTPQINYTVPRHLVESHSADRHFVDAVGGTARSHLCLPSTALTNARRQNVGRLWGIWPEVTAPSIRRSIQSCIYVVGKFFCRNLDSLDHRHLRNIDCLMAHTACLVCFISTVNGCSKKVRKEAYYERR